MAKKTSATTKVAAQKKIGFAALSKAERTALASKGGKARVKKARAAAKATAKPVAKKAAKKVVSKKK